jgi:hypothetical protein
MELSAMDLEIRRRLFALFVQDGRAPTAAAIASALHLGIPAVEEAFRRLESKRILTLFAGRTDIRMLLPFSAVPTAFRVEAGGRSWWGNCAWCALGIVAALRSGGRIFTVCGQCEAALFWDVQGSVAADPASLVHFSIPAARWWDDVVTSCATILAFDGPEHVVSWNRDRSRQPGEVVPVETTWQLARAVFGDHLDAAWRPKRPSELAAIFADLRLTGPFWSLAKG